MLMKKAGASACVCCSKNTKHPEKGTLTECHQIGEGRGAAARAQVAMANEGMRGALDVDVHASLGLGVDSAAKDRGGMPAQPDGGSLVRPNWRMLLTADSA